MHSNVCIGFLLERVFVFSFPDGSVACKHNRMEQKEALFFLFKWSKTPACKNFIDFWCQVERWMQRLRQLLGLQPSVLTLDSISGTDSCTRVWLMVEWWWRKHQLALNKHVLGGSEAMYTNPICCQVQQRRHLQFLHWLVKYDFFLFSISYFLSLTPSLSSSGSSDLLPSVLKAYNSEVQVRKKINRISLVPKYLVEMVLGRAIGHLTLIRL